SHPLDGLRIFAGGGAGALQADLARDDFLEREGYVGGDVADEDDGAALASCVDRSGDGFVAADTFESDVNSFVVGALENCGEQGIPREKTFGCAEFASEFETLRVDVGDEDFGTASGAESL